MALTQLSGTAPRADTLGMANESLPLRKGDMLFVVAVVMLALTLPTTTAKALIASGAAVLLWIRFRVYGGSSRYSKRLPG